ncbi:hypothetical protein EPA93_37860 [Ktedonosporobacter rubrisoli]|uniref:Zinc-finger domain-containing protein n=1 Tax=Ktedonosporobacter rubrisoli TaxID=2509675 RepID=A0A4P6K077_KTERU|nr:hypothetical protein [Ktedonosporobacter rubrisoli]QBD81434.1 hypothetical protein EPA93_37860 [Ktedonosporobacter rubrisoli]
MDCLHSMAPDDEALLRYVLDNEPLPKFAKVHIEQCAICQQRLDDFRRPHDFLLSRLYRSQCPDVTALNHYCAGLLPADEVVAIAEHVEQCPLCANEVAEIHQVLADFEPFPQTTSENKLYTGLRCIFAQLVPWQPQFVTRGEPANVNEPSWPRQYRAESMNISLHLSRSASGETLLLGLFSSTDPAESTEDLEGLTVKLARTVGTQARQDEVNGHHMPPMFTQVDDLGNIVFKAVSPGMYTLSVYLPDAELVITGLSIAR